MSESAPLSTLPNKNHPQNERAVPYFSIPLERYGLIGNLQVESKPFAGGGVGDLYRAVMPSGKEYALKTVSFNKFRDRHPSLYKDDLLAVWSSAQAELEREATLVQSIPQHKNIVRGYGTIIFNDRVFAVFEMLDPKKWQNLRSVRSTGERFSLQNTADIMKQTVDGFKHARLHMTPQRDPKPDNIMITKAETRPGAYDVKLVDFGASDLVLDKNSFAISPGYTAPEFYSNGTYTPQTMVYSLGIVATEMVTGFNVFKDLKDEIETHKYNGVADRVDLYLEQTGYPENVRKVFSTAVGPLETRYQTSEEFVAALEHIADFSIHTVSEPVEDTDETYLTQQFTTPNTIIVNEGTPRQHLLQRLIARIRSI